MLYNNPELFLHDICATEINKNKHKCKQIINDAVRTSVRLMLPMKEILLKYLTQRYDKNTSKNDQTDHYDFNVLESSEMNGYSSNDDNLPNVDTSKNDVNVPSIDTPKNDMSETQKRVTIIAQTNNDANVQALPQENNTATGNQQKAFRMIDLEPILKAGGKTRTLIKDLVSDVKLTTTNNSIQSIGAVGVAGNASINDNKHTNNIIAGDIINNGADNNVGNDMKNVVANDPNNNTDKVVDDIVDSILVI